MRTILIISTKLKYLGLLGLPTFFSDAVIWKYMWLFWLFGIVQLVLTFPSFIQQLRQIWGIIVIAIKTDSGRKSIDMPTSLEYSLPFEGEWLIINGGITKELSHSWDIYPQRYAYDFLQVGAELQSFNGDQMQVTSYYCYGQNVLAPADGEVIEAFNHCRDSKIMKNQGTDPLIRDLRGNFIVIKHAENEYSLLAHLRPGSICVKAGDFVSRGQKIAECGNTGNTTEPHLHFQVQNGKSFYQSEGLKIRFKNVASRDFPDYEKVDDRPLVIDKTAYAGGEYIHRGMTINNISSDR